MAKLQSRVKDTRYLKEIENSVTIPPFYEQQQQQQQQQQKQKRSNKLKISSFLMIKLKFNGKIYTEVIRGNVQGRHIEF